MFVYGFLVDIRVNLGFDLLIGEVRFLVFRLGRFVGRL